MKFQLSILFSFIAYFSFSQGIEPSQIQGAPKFNQILQAKSMYIDEYGDTLYIYEHTDLKGAPDSLFVMNDTIYLRDGSGFVKIQTNPDSLFLRNDTIYLRDGSGFVKIPPSINATINKTVSGFDYTINSSGNTHTINIPIIGSSTSINVGVGNTSLPINSAYLGQGAGENLTGSNNVAIGRQALRGASGSTGTNNVGIGIQSLLNLTSGYNNLGMGAFSLYYNTSGYNNVGIGEQALLNNTSGYYNVGIGRYSLQSVTTGNSNMGIGSLSFRTGNGNSNIGIGYASGEYNTGNNNAFIGFGSGKSSGSNSGSVFIGYLAGETVTRSNTFIVNNANENINLISGYFDTKRVGINVGINDIQNTLHVGGDLRVDNRSGTAIIGAGFDANGRLVQYNLDTAITIPETSITNGTHISVTGNGSNSDPYVITNTMPFQTLSTNNTPGNISLSNGGGTLTLNVNDADSIATNELQDLYPYSTGFNLSNPNTSLEDTVLFDYQASGSGAFVPASNYIAGAGINITGNTISSTVTNTDAQAISKSGNVISITGNASTVNIANGTPTEGQVMTWQSGNWVATTPSAGIQFFDAIINSPFSGTSGTPTVLTLSLAAGTYKTDAFCKISNETGTANTLSLQLFNQNTGVTLFTSSAQIPSFGNVTIPVARNFTIASTNTIGLRVSTSFNFFINTNECILNALKVN